VNEMSKSIDVITIDPHLCIIMSKQITNTLEQFQKAVGDHHIELVRIDDTNIMYVDSEGLYRPDQNYFVITGSERCLPIAGPAVILGGDDSGDSVSTNMTIFDVSKMVSFHTPIEMHDMAQAGKFS
jgi:hypothetical protein